MAVESLGGGIADQIRQLPTEAVQILESVLRDTVGGTANVQQVAPGVTAVTAQAAAMPGIGEVIQTAVVATQAANNATLSDGAITVAVTAPGQSVVTMEGSKGVTTAEGANTYLQALLDAAISAEVAAANPAANQERQQLEKAIQIVAPMAENAAVRVVQVDPGSTAPVKLDFSQSRADVVAVLVAQGTERVTAEVVDAKALAVVGTADVTVRSTDGTGAQVVGDAAWQRIDGAQNSGRDTLIGGAGNDTLVGGAGDVIGFNGLGHFTVEGANRGVTFTFLFDGINSVQDLAKYLTGVTQTAQGVTYHFGPSASITLVGVSAAQVTAEMIHFTL